MSLPKLRKEREKTVPNKFSCPIATTLSVVGGKWKLAILWHLMGATHRFGELTRLLPGVTPQMLTQQLRELEADGLVCRKIYPQVPPKVEYSLTDYGQTLRVVLESMCMWGERHRTHN